MKIIKGSFIYLIVVLFLLTFLADGPLLFSAKANSVMANSSESNFIINEKEAVKVKTPKAESPLRNISQGLGGEAVAVTNKALSSCQGLPVEIWIFLLSMFMALLIFNLSYNFSRARKIQWGWEVILLLLTLGAWLIFDECRANIWFPLYVIKLGLIIYLAYLYFLEKKPKNMNSEEQESLF